MPKMKKKPKKSKIIKMLEKNDHGWLFEIDGQLYFYLFNADNITSIMVDVIAAEENLKSEREMESAYYEANDMFNEEIEEKLLSSHGVQLIMEYHNMDRFVPNSPCPNCDNEPIAIKFRKHVFCVECGTVSEIN